MKEEPDRNNLRENSSESASPRESPVATTSHQPSQHYEPEISQTSPRSTSRIRRTLHSPLTLTTLLKEFKSYILSSEDDIHLQCALRKDNERGAVDREPIFVIVDSSGVSNPSSREILIDKNTNLTDHIFTKFLNKNVIPNDFPSTSKNVPAELFQFPPRLRESDSRDEMLMVDINLQSENEIAVDDADSDNESIVLSYLRNKDAFSDMEGTLLSTKKKSSLLESVPKLETIEEGKRFSAFAKDELAPDVKSDEEDRED